MFWRYRRAVVRKWLTITGKSCGRLKAWRAPGRPNWARIARLEIGVRDSG